MLLNIIAKYGNRPRMEDRKVQRGEYGSDTANRKRLSPRAVFTSNCCFLLTAALLAIPSSRAYTLNTISPTVLSPDIDASMFGYAIAFYDKPDKSRWLLVGAPSWNATQQGGALFQCSLDTLSPSCQTLNVDRGETTCTEPRCNDITASQRLGATLAVHEDTALVCAPNWSYVLINNVGKTVGTPVGKCFYSDNNALTNFNSFSSVYDTKPKDNNLNYLTTGYCQAGFSALLLPQTKGIALGSPGCYSWTGDVMVGEPHSKTYANKGKIYSPIKDFGVTSAYEKMEPVNRFLGFSIAKGTFNNKLSVVAGSPKETKYPIMNAILKASVSVLEQLNDQNLTIWAQLYPPLDQGWYFSFCGYSVAVGDLNGDGLDDVAVGCPNYGGDRGAVLVYYQIKNVDGTFKMELEKPEYRTGPEKGARFGTSVTVLSDIDGDGHQELAVGSPFTREGEDSSGRLYIYCSTKGQDLPKTPCQEVAYSSTAVSGLGLRNFGWSATSHGSLVAVSAPASDTVLVFSTRPVVQLNVTVVAPDELDVSQLCSVKSGENAPCVNISVCLKYTIRNGPQDSIERDMSVDVQLEPMKALYFETGAKSAQVNFNSKVDGESCKELKVYDKKKSDEIVEYKITARGSFTPAQGDPVVLDVRQGLESSAMLRMKVDCADATYDTCQPDVRVSIRQDGDFVLGVQEAVQLTVTIAVSGDPAYYPKLVLSSADFRASFRNYTVKGALGQCTENNATHAIVCSLGGVLQNMRATVTLSLSGSTNFYDNLRSGDDFFMVMASASCSSPFLVPSNGNDTKRVDISVLPQTLKLSRSTSSDILDLSTWNEEPSSALESKGPKMVHTYEVYNPNKYDLYGVSLTIYWPQKHKEGYMLYTSRAPTFQRADGETGYCEAVAGGGFDEQQLSDTNTTDTVLSRTPSTTSGDVLGSADIQPLVIECVLGDMTPMYRFVVEVESYAFYQTFDKIKENPVNSINSEGKVAPSSAPLGKAFTDSDTKSITNVVIYPKIPFPWWWYLLGAVVGVILIVIMGVFFKKYVIDRRKKEVSGVDETDGEEKTNMNAGEGEAGGQYAAAEETQDWEEAGETSQMHS